MKTGAASATYFAAGFKDCDKDYAKNGCEINVHTDPNNCGNCGIKCGGCANAVPTCKSGKGEFSCTAPYQNCDNSWSDGWEINVSNDVNNCGGCRKKCSPVAHANVKCSNSKCEYTCHPGWRNCDNNWMNGCETEVSMNVNNCGGCNIKCSQPKYYGGEAGCTCEAESCKKWLKYEKAK
ncbi:uncharacterized protein [Physcomitrium patens]|uniref:uncharacterized protein isoform X1 n=1 Tax=Physcomitrium patens TaxID=3218 RepID=UPI003CCCBBCB